LFVFAEPQKKRQILEILDGGEKKSLEDLLQIQEGYEDLKPIPSPNVLLKLGPKGSRPDVQIFLQDHLHITSKSVTGLLKFHKAIINQTNLYYCAERMALAGVSTSLMHIQSVLLGSQKDFFKKDFFHYQPKRSVQG